MKFMFFFYPAIPCTMEEREKLRPIAARTDRFQQMLDEIVELSQLAEEVVAAGYGRASSAGLC